PALDRWRNRSPDRWRVLAWPAHRCPPACSGSPCLAENPARPRAPRTAEPAPLRLAVPTRGSRMPRASLPVAQTAWAAQPSMKRARTATVHVGDLPQLATRVADSRCRSQRARDRFCSNYRNYWTRLMACALMPLRTMRFAAAALVLVFAGCPASDTPGLDHPDGGMGDAGTDAGPSCTAIPTCTTTIRFKGNAQSVSLRGDFAADGWTTGIAMTKNGDAWEATVPVHDNQVILYKFVVDGTSWIADPDNVR